MHDRAILRPYQFDFKRDIYGAWNAGARNVLGVLPTGAGKTVTFSDILHDHSGGSCAIAHRQELVGQISLALARDHVRHKIVGPKKVVKRCVAEHMEEIGASYYDPSAPAAVAGVDTLVKRADALAAWLNTVSLIVQDEAHHVLRENKWGSAAGMFPNARMLGVTATPLRADGKGLGRHADGLFDSMVEGPGMRELINAGYLSDYRIFAPESDLDLSDVNVTAKGDYNPDKLKRAVRRSRIVGDVVAHYLRIAPGKLGVTFATDVETATDIAAQFNAAGVPAAVVSAKTPDAERAAILRRFKAREILQLVNVDLFGEGFDVPSIEVVSMARPTQSLGVYMQQFGRALRILAGKKFGIIIDHVGNVDRHLLPDRKRTWTLDRRERRSTAKNDGIPVRGCPACTAVFERIYKACPFCGFVATPSARSAPEFVDGDLCELTPETLAAMRGEVEVVDLNSADYGRYLNSRGMPQVGQPAAVRRHLEQQGAQTQLRDRIALWAGHQVAAGRPDSESYRRFYFSFGVDVLGAQKLGAKEATELTNTINKELASV